MARTFITAALAAAALALPSLAHSAPTADAAPAAKSKQPATVAYVKALEKRINNQHRRLRFLEKENVELSGLYNGLAIQMMAFDCLGGMQAAPFFNWLLQPYLPSFGYPAEETPLYFVGIMPECLDLSEAQPDQKRAQAHDDTFQPLRSLITRR